MSRRSESVTRSIGTAFAREVAVRRQPLFWMLLACCLLPLAGCGSNEPDLGDAAEHFLAAQDALDKGDTQTALNELNISIQLEPDTWAYYQRARILTDQDKIDQAQADCQAGLNLDPNHAELEWLAAELKKPADRRFQGKNAKPPTARK